MYKDLCHFVSREQDNLTKQIRYLVREVPRITYDLRQDPRNNRGTLVYLRDQLY